MKVKVFVCEDCGVFDMGLASYTEEVFVEGHEGHCGVAIEGDDLSELQQLAVKHVELAQRIRGMLDE